MSEILFFDELQNSHDQEKCLVAIALSYVYPFSQLWQDWSFSMQLPGK
jgi:hypothetical protein